MSGSAAFWLKRAVGVTSFLFFSFALGCGDTTRAFVDDTTPDSAAPGVDVSVDPDAVIVVDVAVDTDSSRDAGGDATSGQDTSVADARDARDAAASDGVVVDIGQDVEFDAGGDVANQPPTIVNTIPGDSATSVSVTTTISIDFSKAMNPSTVTVALQPSVALGTAIWNMTYTSIAFTPPTALAAMTGFTVTVTGSDNAGRALTGQTTFAFTTGAGADVTPPAIRGTVPANNATDVPAGTNIIVTFTEPMDVGSVMVTSVPDIMLGMPTFSAQNDQVTFTPTTALLPFTEYTITVAGQDPAKNALAPPTTFKFTTQKPPDTTPPTIVAVQPANGATAVPSNSSIVITFSETMNVVATTSALSVSPAVTCTGGWSWNVAATTASCIPATPLSYSTMYTVNVAATASDVSGNAMGSAYASSFITGVMPDTTPPTIVSVVPVNGATGVPRGAKIVVTFSEAMDINSAQLAFSITSPMGVTGTPTWANGNTQMTYTPSASFDYGTTVNWQVSTAAKDASGNAKTTLDSYSFNVIKSATTTIPCIAPLDGYVSNPTNFVNPTGSIVPGQASNPATYRGFAAFDITSLPAALTTVTSAAMYLKQYSLTGTPYGTTKLGDVLWRHVDYGPTLELADYSVATLIHGGNAGTLSVDGTFEYKSAVVTLSVQNDFVNRVARGNRSEFLLRFTYDTSTPAATDLAFFYACDTTVTTDRPYLSVTYEYP
jgi:hypothetical protein